MSLHVEWVVIAMDQPWIRTRLLTPQSFTIEMYLAPKSFPSSFRACRGSNHSASSAGSKGEKVAQRGCVRRESVSMLKGGCYSGLVLAEGIKPCQ